MLGPQLQLRLPLWVYSVTTRVILWRLRRRANQSVWFQFWIFFFLFWFSPSCTMSMPPQQNATFRSARMWVIASDWSGPCELFPLPVSSLGSAVNIAPSLAKLQSNQRLAAPQPASPLCAEIMGIYNLHKGAVRLIFYLINTNATFCKCMYRCWLRSHRER